RRDEGDHDRRRRADRRPARLLRPRHFALQSPGGAKPARLAGGAPRLPGRGTAERGGSMRVLITGATGYLGAHVAARLVSAGHAVRALVRPGRGASVPAGGVPVEGGLLEAASRGRAL